MLRPIMRLALDRGLKYQDIDELIRDLMLDEAARDWAKRNGKEPSGSQLSVTTGINRKEVKKRTESVSTSDRLPASSRSVVAQVFTVWQTHIELNPERKRLTLLDRDVTNKSAVSFESIVRQCGADVHHRSVLDELLRLGVVRVQAGNVEMITQHYVARRGSPEALAIGADNVAAHINAAVDNLAFQSNQSQHLEQSIWADGFGFEDCMAIVAAAREGWQNARSNLRPLIQNAVSKPDERQPYKIRIGMYAYFEDLSGTERCET